MSFVLRKLSPGKQLDVSACIITFHMEHVTAHHLLLCMCVFAVVCVFVCPLEYLFLWENAKWHPSHYFIPSNYAALLWHVSACEIAQRDIWCHNKKASIPIDYQSSQQRRGFISCHFHPALDTFPAVSTEENLLCEPRRWIIHNTSWVDRNTKTKSATGTPDVSWSSDCDDCGSLGHRWYRRQNPSCRDPHHCFTRVLGRS